MPLKAHGEGASLPGPRRLHLVLRTIALSLHVRHEDARGDAGPVRSAGATSRTQKKTTVAPTTPDPLSTESLERLAVESGRKTGHVQTDNAKWTTCVDCNRR